MNPFASLTSFVISFLEILHVPHVEQNGIAKQLISVSLTQALSNLAKAAPADAKSLLDGTMISKSSLTEAYAVVIKHIGEAEAKKILAQSLRHNMLEYASGTISETVAKEEKERIEQFAQESVLSAVIEIPKTFIDLIAD